MEETNEICKCCGGRIGVCVVCGEEFSKVKSNQETCAKFACKTVNNRRKRVERGLPAQKYYYIKKKDR